jgi:AmiR/NasT family two-component response regulator
MSQTPNFAGMTVAILHREDGNTERLVRQLRLLGLRSSVQWTPLDPADPVDIVMVDADQGWDGLLKPQGASCVHPVVALLGSEAPGRVAWALSQGASAIIAKPVASSAVYPALVMALSIHRERADAAQRLAHLEERIRLRPLVHAAIGLLMNERGLDEERAYAVLRGCAMRRRLPMEQVAASIIGGAEPLPEAG